MMIIFLAKQPQKNPRNTNQICVIRVLRGIKNTAPPDNKERCDDEGIMVKKKTED